MPPAGGTVANAWSSQPTTSGTATTFANAAWNGSIPAGGYTELGFWGTGSPTPATVGCWQVAGAFA